MKASNAAAVRTIKAFGKRVDADVDKTVRAVGLTLFAAVIKRSPVDTGRFRANWSVQSDLTPQTTPEKDKLGGATIAKAQAELETKKAGDSIKLLNHLPYSIELENGSSKQAPAGMVKITVTEFQQYVRDAAARLKKR